jgi:hypothetical protein
MHKYAHINLNLLFGWACRARTMFAGLVTRSGRMPVRAGVRMFTHRETKRPRTHPFAAVNTIGDEARTGTLEVL